MKKLYIQPSMEIELVETSDMIAGSPRLQVLKYTDEDILTQSQLEKPTEGNLSDMAKGNNLWLSDEDSDW